MIIEKWQPVVMIGLMFSLISSNSPEQINEKYFDISGKQVKVTHDADDSFYGRYQGNKEGYLLLRKDGTGEYRYDIHVSGKSSCLEGTIEFEWGFILDETNGVVRFEREYGYSYPIVYRATGERSFQGCQKEYLVDYILDKKNGRLAVSSSDDWEKLKEAVSMGSKQ